MELVPDIDRLTQIFSNAVAPSFFLGAVAAFVSLMMSRLAAVNAHIKATRALPDQDRSAVGSSMAVIVGNSIRLASEVESGDALG